MWTSHPVIVTIIRSILGSSSIPIPVHFRWPGAGCFQAVASMRARHRQTLLTGAYRFKAWGLGFRI